MRLQDDAQLGNHRVCEPYTYGSQAGNFHDVHAYPSSTKNISAHAKLTHCSHTSQTQ